MQTTPVVEPRMTKEGVNGRWRDHNGKSRAMTISGEPETGSNGKPGAVSPIMCMYACLLTEYTGEVQGSKYLPRDIYNGTIPSRPMEPTPISSIRPDPFPTPATRRRQSSIREQRAIQPSGALPNSPSKRYVDNERSHLRKMLLINSGWLITASRICGIRLEVLLQYRLRRAIPDNPLSTTRQDSASLIQVQSRNEMPPNRRDPLISSPQPISMTFKIALNRVILSHSQPPMELHKCLVA